MSEAAGVEIDACAGRLIAVYLPSVLIGGLAAFSYLALLARAHLRLQALIRLLAEVVRRRAEQEEIRDRLGDAPQLDRYSRIEARLRALLDAQGLRSAAPPGRAPR
jgi:predicted aminopeptidase